MKIEEKKKDQKVTKEINLTALKMIYNVEDPFTDMAIYYFIV